MKPCIKCGAIDRMASGRCRPCTKAYKAAYHLANREKLIAKTAAWRKDNPERTQAQFVAYRAANRDKNKIQNAAWRKANMEKAKILNARWAKSNPQKANARANRHRASKLNATPLWANRFFIEEIYDLARLRTKATGLKWHVDHIVPLQSQIVCGLHIEHNLQVVPARHNLSKGNFYWPDMP